ncbi:hypothetical protein [Arenimonas soli]|nr:hypothetical protein [Arenimonas soli]
MNNVIAFLERMGRNPSLAQLPAAELASEARDLGLDDAPLQALLDRDADALNGLLGGRHKMMCMLFPAEGDDQKKQDDEQEDSEQPDDDDRKESIQRNGRH